MKKYKLIILACSLLYSVTARELPGLDNSSSSGWSRFLTKSAALDQYSLINIGNMEYWVAEDGKSCHTAEGGSGGIYPRSTAGAIYLDGILVGGYQEGALKVSGQIYRTGTVKGYIGPNGLTTGDDVRIYRIRKDWATLTPAMVRQETAEYFEMSIGSVTDADMQVVLDNYATDWAAWPTHLGAPFYDLDNDGVYDPADGETPGVANADQVLWFVCSDADPTTTADLYGTEPMNIEMQMTLWGYNQPGAGLGQITFKQTRIINRSSADITDAYISQWSDPDLGDYGNDLVGVDTTLSLMYAYNGEVEDAQYSAFGLAPAAIGYDYFAGPKIPGEATDTAIFNLQKLPGYKNMPATSFGYFSAGGTYSDPGPYGNVEAAREYYNLMRGYAPIDDLDNPTAWVDENGDATLFPYKGDPVLGTGHLDSSPGDRRMLINSGPFTLAAGDTQDVVEAIIGGLGDNQLTSITDMKFTDQVAQALFDDLFQSVPSAPSAPNVSVTTTEESVVLNWGDDLNAILATEYNPVAGYEFEGYNVYQLPTATSALSDAVKIATFDLENGVTEILGNVFLPEYGTQVSIPVQNGLDVGVKRYFVAEQDYTTGRPLYAGSEYYFAVTAYNYNPEPDLIEDKALESAHATLAVVVQPPPPGSRYELPAGSALAFTKSGGVSDGLIDGVVVDPGKVTGDTYTIGFAVSPDPDWTDPIWYMQNSSGTKVLDDQAQLGELSDYDDQLVVDGLKVKVSGPPPGINPYRYGVAYGAGSATSATYLTGWDFTGDRWLGGVDWGAGTGRLFGALSNGYEFFGSDLVEGTDFVDVETRWATCTGCTEGMTAREMADQSMSETPELWSKGVVQRRDLGYVTQEGLADIPFAVYNTETDPPTRLQVNIVEDDNDGSGNMLYDWGMDGAGAGAFAPNGGREYTFLSKRAYDYDGDGTGGTLDDYADYLPGGESDPVYNDIMYAFWPQQRGSRGFLHAEFTFSIFASNINVIGEDEWTFTAPAITTTAADKATDYAMMNVYPNPYYANNSQEQNRFDNFVTFTHMPNMATVRIFSIDGTLVRKLDKNDTEQFLKWDLRNSSDLPVASGPYVAYIESDDMDGSKTLKLYVVQRNQLVQYY